MHTGPLRDAPTLAVEGLSKSFGGVRAVDDLTFSVRPGAVTGFLGPNGAGKTSTVRPSAANARSSPRIHLMPSGSSPFAGSSSTIAGGSASRAVARPSRCRMPIE